MNITTLTYHHANLSNARAHRAVLVRVSQDATATAIGCGPYHPRTIAARHAEQALLSCNAYITQLMTARIIGDGMARY